MKRHWFVRAPKILLMVVLAVTICGFVTMNLWNWLMPVLFGLRVIGFWQALGLLILSKLLLGGFRGGPGGHRRWRRGMMARWEAMTPEEREKFRQGMRGRCGSFGPPETEAKA
jgi:hypothetical protein